MKPAWPRPRLGAVDTSSETLSNNTNKTNKNFFVFILYSPLYLISNYDANSRIPGNPVITGIFVMGIKLKSPKWMIKSPKREIKIPGRAWRFWQQPAEPVSSRLFVFAVTTVDFGSGNT
jgi:hypothetical protein